MVPWKKKTWTRCQIVMLSIFFIDTASGLHQFCFGHGNARWWHQWRRTSFSALNPKLGLAAHSPVALFWTQYNFISRDSWPMTPDWQILFLQIHDSWQVTDTVWCILYQNYFFKINQYSMTTVIESCTLICIKCKRMSNESNEFWNIVIIEVQNFTITHPFGAGPSHDHTKLLSLILSISYLRHWSTMHQMKLQQKREPWRTCSYIFQPNCSIM